MFAGLEIRSTLYLDWKGWRLEYASIEAGLAGGRRSEIRLLPYYLGKPAVHEDFVKAAIELAHDFGDSPALIETSFASPSQATTYYRPPVETDKHGNVCKTRPKKVKKEKEAKVWAEQPRAFSDVADFDLREWDATDSWRDVELQTEEFNTFMEDFRDEDLDDMDELSDREDGGDEDNTNEY